MHSGAIIHAWYKQAGRGWGNQKPLISHGTQKSTSKTQKRSIKSKGVGTPACSCGISRGTGQQWRSICSQGFWGLNWCTIFSICYCTCVVYYMYFSVIFTILLCLSLLLARWVVPVGTCAKIDSLLLDRVLTQKICNNLSEMHNNNKNILQNIWKPC